MKRTLLVLAACGGSTPPQPLANAPASGSPVRLTIADDQDLGRFGVAPARTADASHDWLPVGSDTVFEIGMTEGSAAMTPNLAIDAKGTTAKIAVGEDRNVPYGCDQNTLHVTSYRGEPAELAAGLVWLLPRSMPAVWSPAAATIAPGAATPAARRYTVGPIAIELARSDAKHGTIGFRWDGRRLPATLPIERSDMDGADNDVPIDLAAGGVAVPEPIAAWSIAGPQSPYVIAFLAPSYEGLNVRIAIVEAERVRELTDGIYLYRCAF